MTQAQLESIILRESGRLNGHRVIRLSQELLHCSPDPLHMVARAFGLATIALNWAGTIAATLARVLDDGQPQS
jgi:hypothetical protein